MDKKISETYIMETRKDRESDSFGDATYFKLRTDRKYVFAYNEKLEHFEITEVEATKGTLFADNSRYIKAFTENELIEYKAKIRADTIEEFAEAYKNFMNESGCNIHENCIDGDCIDCFKDEWLKGAKK